MFAELVEVLRLDILELFMQKFSRMLPFKPLLSENAIPKQGRENLGPDSEPII